MKFAHGLIAAASMAIAAGTAQAATLSLDGGAPLSYASYGSKYNPSGTSALSEDLYVFDTTSASPGLSVSGPATVTVEFLGREAAAGATASIGGSSVSSTSSIGSSFSIDVAGGALGFSFSSVLGTLASNTNAFIGTAALAFSQVYDGSYVYAFFDDSGAANDRDFDDMVVKISISSITAVPVPASGLLLGGALVAAGAMRKRRKAA